MTIQELLILAKEFAREYVSIIAAVVGILALPFGGKFFYYLVRQRIGSLERELDNARAEIQKLNATLADRTTTFVATLGRLQALETKLQRAQRAFDDGNEVWLRTPIQKPSGYDAGMLCSIPILVIANLKGGVGKTTIAANLLAYFECEKNERVLAIDLDYQGSLSSMLLPDPVNREERSADAIKTLIGGAPPFDANHVLAKSSPVRESKRDSRVIDCDDPFANFETRLLLKWLTGDVERDIRYNLAHILHSPEVQDQFDRVIIDAPPRITTGFMNALCAGTHLVVPFVLDVLSAERVGLFLGGVRQMKGQLFPHLELAGAVGTMKLNRSPTLADTERRAVEEAKRRILQSWGSGEVLERALIPRKQAIADAAGLKIAYYESQDVRDIFNPLGNLICESTARGRIHESRVA
jgi:cellulose biosynthesis protein BcsQ